MSDSSHHPMVETFLTGAADAGQTIERLERALLAAEGHANNKRYFDLVRAARGFLYEEELLSNEEYAQLVDTDGIESNHRLEGYDDMRAERDRMRNVMADVKLALRSMQGAATSRSGYSDERLRTLVWRECAVLIDKLPAENEQPKPKGPKK